jgi:hypothetical protein
MDYSLESTIWKEAQATFSGQGFADVVELAVSSYRRRPGYSGTERVYASDVGQTGLQALRYALRHVDHLPRDEPLPGCISMRAALRAHIYYFLESQFVRTGVASEMVTEDHLARALNL